MFSRRRARSPTSSHTLKLWPCSPRLKSTECNRWVHFWRAASKQHAIFFHMRCADCILTYICICVYICVYLSAIDRWTNRWDRCNSGLSARANVHKHLDLSDTFIPATLFRLSLWLRGNERWRRARWTRAPAQTDKAANHKVTQACIFSHRLGSGLVSL